MFILKIKIINKKPGGETTLETVTLWVVSGGGGSAGDGSGHVGGGRE